jgi:predicted DNA-binding transcriptional regulator AlpA
VRISGSKKGKKFMKNKDKTFITRKECAKLLEIAPLTLDRWIKKDQEIKGNNKKIDKNFKCPPYGRIGNRYRFRREDIEKFIKESMEN